MGATGTTGTLARSAPEEQVLRAEHDALAARLEARRSIDEVRRAAFAALALVITGGVAARLAYDQWGPHPSQASSGMLALFVAAGVALACLAGATVFSLRAWRHMREEDADFARLRQLRARLGLET
jgi:hypothetical protein